MICKMPYLSIFAISKYYSCSGLTKVSFGESVTNVGNNAFGLCLAIVTVESKNSEPPMMNDAFADEPYLNGTLYVPREAIPTYGEHSVGMLQAFLC